MAAAEPRAGSAAAPAPAPAAQPARARSRRSSGGRSRAPHDVRDAGDQPRTTAQSSAESGAERCDQLGAGTATGPATGPAEPRRHGPARRDERAGRAALRTTCRRPCSASPSPASRRPTAPIPRVVHASGEGSPTSGPNPLALQSKQSTMLGVAIPGIAPTHGSPPGHHGATVQMAQSPQTPQAQQQHQPRMPSQVQNTALGVMAPPEVKIVPRPKTLIDELRSPSRTAAPAEEGRSRGRRGRHPLRDRRRSPAAASRSSRSATAARSPRSRSSTRTARESLKIGCTSCPDGTTVSLGASTATRDRRQRCPSAPRAALDRRQRSHREDRAPRGRTSRGREGPRAGRLSRARRSLDALREAARDHGPHRGDPRQHGQRRGQAGHARRHRPRLLRDRSLEGDRRHRRDEDLRAQDPVRDHAEGRQGRDAGSSPPAPRSCRSRSMRRDAELVTDKGSAAVAGQTRRRQHGHHRRPERRRRRAGQVRRARRAVGGRRQGARDRRVLAAESRRASSR